MKNDRTDGEDPLFVTPEAADYIRMSVPSLERWRGQGRGPDFCKLGGSVRYRKSALDRYLDASTRSLPRGRNADTSKEGRVIDVPNKRRGATPKGAPGNSSRLAADDLNNMRPRPASQAEKRNPLADVRLKYLAARLHALGPKPLFYFLDEVEGGAGLREHLEAYAALPADFIKAYGGDRFKPRAFLVRGGAAR